MQAIQLTLTHFIILANALFTLLKSTCYLFEGIQPVENLSHQHHQHHHHHHQSTNWQNQLTPRRATPTFFILFFIFLSYSLSAIPEKTSRLVSSSSQPHIKTSAAEYGKEPRTTLLKRSRRAAGQVKDAACSDDLVLGACGQNLKVESRLRLSVRSESNLGQIFKVEDGLGKVK